MSSAVTSAWKAVADRRPASVSDTRTARRSPGTAARSTNLDISWFKDDSLDDPDSLPAPEVLIAEIQEEMAAILKQFGELAAGVGVEPLEAADVAE